jgi:hypothetical protein
MGYRAPFAHHQTAPFEISTQHFNAYVLVSYIAYLKKKILKDQKPWPGSTE